MHPQAYTLKSLDQAAQLAQSETASSIPCDLGPNVSPRYDVIPLPQLDDPVRNGLSGDKLREIFSKSRELAHSELPCLIPGCCLGANHEGPCVPRHPDEETIEIREQNLMVLVRDDPEGFRLRIRELLKK